MAHSCRMGPKCGKQQDRNLERSVSVPLYWSRVQGLTAVPSFRDTLSHEFSYQLDTKLKFYICLKFPYLLKAGQRTVSAHLPGSFLHLNCFSLDYSDMASVSARGLGKQFLL